MKITNLLFVLLACFMIASCGKDQFEQDIDDINDYLNDNGLTADRTTSGLHYIINDPGNGVDRPNINSEVKVDYTGYTLDGDVFDESNPDSLAFWPLFGLIQGWQEGLPLFTKGGHGQLFIPSRLGYGQTGSGSIPPNTVLIFDIRLVDID